MIYDFVGFGLYGGFVYAHFYDRVERITTAEHYEEFKENIKRQAEAMRLLAEELEESSLEDLQISLRDRLK